jgi:serine protease inhibitor
VEDQTNRRIKDMIPRDVLDEESKRLVRLILTNAIYFKGEWEEVFPQGQTKEDSFLLADQTKVRVPLMRKDHMASARYAAFRADGSRFPTPSHIDLNRTDPDEGYPDKQGLQLLELPYKGGTLSMVLIVPRSADGLAAIEKGLTASRLQGWIGSLQQRRTNVVLPRFKLETKYDLGKVLQQMGMPRAFRDPRAKDGAQFDGMTQTQDPAEKLYISKVLHKAFVEVNEKGTEAAAATAVIMAVPTAAPLSVPFVPTVRADRPFLFLIRDVPTGSILFLGRMTNPSAQGG